MGLGANRNQQPRFMRPAYAAITSKQRICPTCQGREFGGLCSTLSKMFRRLKEIKHDITKIEQPQSHGIDERFHRTTVLGEQLVQHDTRRLPLYRNVSGGCQITTGYLEKLRIVPGDLIHCPCDLGGGCECREKQVFGT